MYQTGFNHMPIGHRDKLNAFLPANLDESGPMDLETLELLETARQGLSRTTSEELGQ